MMTQFIALAAKSFGAQDGVAIGLIAGIFDITKASSNGDDIKDVQKTIDEFLDPLLRMLSACAPHSPMFGPSLEDILMDSVKLKETHQSLLIHAVRPLYGDVVSPHKIAELILTSFTLSAERLTSEMTIPQQGGSYPFGWGQSSNFELHPVVDSLHTLMPWIEKVAAEDESLHALKVSAKTNLVACLANWCGHEARSGPASTNTAVSKVILDAVFDESYLQGALKGLDDKGRPIFAQYVMDNHKGLRRLLPRVAKGEYLSDSLGL
jgi:hypothetical protein